jgi:hypothetical protein
MKVQGLNKLDKLITKLDKLEDFILDQTANIIEKNRKILEDANRYQLNAAGIGSDGNELEYIGNRSTPVDGPYTKPYSKYKDKKGGQTSHVDLRLSGDFHKSIQLGEVEANVWDFTSEDPKFEWLKNMYGDTILGVTEERLQEFAENPLQIQLQAKLDKYTSK